MAESVEDKCRGKLARLLNDPPHSIWIPNKNTGLGYISGLPDAHVRFFGGRLADVECKGDNASLYLGDPLDEDATTGWHFHQRSWWQNNVVPLCSPYFIAALVSAERTYTRFDFSTAGLFLVPPEAWLDLEALIFPRKTASLCADLERILAYKPVTLDVIWAQYRLPYVNQQFVIPETHPIYKLIHPGA